MAGRKEYEMLFQLNAQLGGSYSKTFKAAQQEIVSMQKEIQALSKTQADIFAFQKQQAAVEATRKRLEMLRQQYDNIQREMEETGNESADMKNKLLAKQLQIDKTSASLEKQTAKLNELSGALEEAGINTDDLSHSSEQLAGKIDTLKKSASAKQSRIKELDELLRMAQYYVDGKSVADKLRSIRFEKSRQKYKSEHDDTLRTFYMAERKLKPHFKDGKLPIAAWRKERAQLEQEYRDIQTELSPLHADAKKLWAIHYNIYEVQHEQERQNTELRQKKQEIEH